MIGTVAVTHEGWYRYLAARPDLYEVNFWKPSARRGFRPPRFSPVLFKLRAPFNAVCGFAYFAEFSRLPPWLAWEVFGEGNGCATREELLARIEEIRRRIGYEGDDGQGQIGCVLLISPVFFPREAWLPQPSDWPVRTQSEKRYDLEAGEGRRLWQGCLGTARELGRDDRAFPLYEAVQSERYGAPTLVRPRLGQGTFRIAVTEAYGRACAVSGEHSLPALEAAHIHDYHSGGPHETCNGLLLRADLHRLFDAGYVTVTPDYTFLVSKRLRAEYSNGRSYYPLDGKRVTLPRSREDRPLQEYLRWHNENRFAA